MTPRKRAEQWTTTQVAEYLGFRGTRASRTASARRAMHMWGIDPIARSVGRGGENLYPADQIRRKRPKAATDQQPPTEKE